jgi:D-3-phosphoglycerate dehydrogenase
LSSPTVLVTPRSLTSKPETVRAMLKARGYEATFSAAGLQPNSQELRQLLTDCVGWIAGVEPITAEVLGSAPHLKVISRFGTGTSNVDLEAARRLGIDVAIAAGANAQSVAELALTLTLDCLRGVGASARSVASGEWERQPAREIADLDVLVAGYGAIGRRYADLMLRLGARVAVFDPFLPDSEVMPTGMSLVQDFAAALAQADVVSLHCPPGEMALLNEEGLSGCRSGLIVINTARSELVDDDAMLEAIETGKVASYAVDAFDQEPPVLTPLLMHRQVTATPHIGAFTAQAVHRTLEVSVDNLVKALARRGALTAVPMDASLTAHLTEQAQSERLRIYWLGQAGFLIRTSTGLNILIDAYLSDVLKDKYQGKIFPHERMMAAPILPEDLPRIDLVLVSHGHTDHLDPETVSTIARVHPDALFVVPNRVRAIALERGIPEERLLTALGDDVLEPLDGLRIHALPSAHEELDVDADGSLFLGYVIEVGDERIYHSGDCAPYPDLVRRLTAVQPTIALLPVNGRDEFRRSNGVPGNFTLAEALELCETVEIPSLVVHHWGMFDFNTVGKDFLERQRAAYSGPISWYIPDLSVFYER